jgi:hypothetical protein
MGSYATYQPKLLPTFLGGEWGERWASASGLMKDVWGEAAAQAVLCRFIQTAPEDALSLIGDERGLPRNPGESTAAFRTRLLAAWSMWTMAGTKAGIVSALNYLGFLNVSIYENADWTIAPGPGYSLGDEWWRFWVVIRQPHGFGPPAWRIGDGSLVGAPGLRVGFMYAPVTHPTIRPTIERWKPAHAMLMQIVVVLSGKLIGDGWTIGDGTVVGGESVTI